MYGFFGSLLVLILLSFQGLCQGSKSDSIRTSAKDSVNSPSYVSVGLDVSRLLLSSIPSGLSGAEMSVDFRKQKILTDFHIGFANHSKDFATYRATSNGIYSGLGISRSLYKDEANVLAFGLRVMGSSFNYQPKSVLINRYAALGVDKVVLPESKNFAVWGELNAVVRTRITGWFMMGFELRVKTMFYKQFSGFAPYFVPGYGIGKNSFSPGINYFIFVQIPKGKSRVGKTDKNIP